jgi:hypothetical protein
MEPAILTGRCVPDIETNTSSLFILDHFLPKLDANGARAQSRLRLAKALAHHTPKYQCRPTLVANQSVVARMTVSMQLRSVIYELDLVVRRNSGAARANTRSSQEQHVAVAF